MKTYMLYSSILFALFVGTTQLSAQSKAENLSEEQKAVIAANLKEYFAALDLSKEQKKDFERIIRKYAAEMKDVAAGSGGKIQKGRQLKAIRKKKDAEMQELLTDDQFNIYLKKRDELVEQAKERRGS